jgi:hypothetical protein
VEQIEAPDGSEVRVLVKAPAPGGYAAVVFPKTVYSFVAPLPASPGHWMIKGAKELTIDGQGSTRNFASPVVAGVTIGSSQRIIFRGFNVDWPNELMPRWGRLLPVDKAGQTMTVKIHPQYHVNANTHIVALSLWDAKSDPKNPHLPLKDLPITMANSRFEGGLFRGFGRIPAPSIPSVLGSCRPQI